MNALLWMIRYTFYGQRHCPIGWRTWWHFAKTAGYLLVAVTESGDVVMSSGDGIWASVGPNFYTSPSTQEGDV